MNDDDDNDGWNAIIIKWNQMNCSWTIWPNYMAKLHLLRYFWLRVFFFFFFILLHTPSSTASLLLPFSLSFSAKQNSLSFQ